MRMIAILPLLMLFGATFAFTLSDYYKPGETDAQVTREFFNLNHEVYYIVNISGSPTFLVRGELLLSEKGDIDAALKSYYSSRYSLNNSEINALKSYFVEYNASRDNGGRYPGKEEHSCMQELKVTTLFPCYDDTSCENSSKKLCYYLQKATGCSNPEDIVQPLKDFALSSLGTDSLLSGIFNKLDNMGQENQAEYLVKIKEDITKLKAYRTKIDNTSFRMPTINTTCRNCWGVCPDINLDESQLAKAETATAQMSAKISPLLGYANLASTIASNTNARLEMIETGEEQEYYTNIFTPLKERGKDVRTRTEAALQIVDNSTMRSKLERMTQIETEISGRITAGNFTGINESIQEYAELGKQLNSSLAFATIAYNKTLNSSTQAAVYTFMADGQVLTPDAVKKLGALKQKRMALDQQLKMGLTATQYEDMQTQYAAMVKDEKAIIAGGGSLENTFYAFTGMAGKLSDGLYAVHTQITPISYEERMAISPYLPAGLSALLFLSFSGGVMFLLILYYGTAAKPMNRIMLGILAIFLIAILAVVSFGIFVSLDRSLNKLRFADFVELLSYEKDATIIINKGGADGSTLLSMEYCAASLKAALAKRGINSTTYETSGTACTTVGGAAVPDCLDKAAGTPVIMFNASASESAAYYGLFRNQAIINGGNAFYSGCPVAEAIRIS